MKEEKANVLVVDDQINILATLGDILKDRNYAVTMVENGYKAIELIKCKYFDIVLMDMKMPGINGLDTFREVKKISPSTTVVMMTGSPVEALIKKAIEEGAYTIVYKPFNVKKLMHIIEEALKKPLILVVDDRMSDRETLKDILMDKEFRVVTARDGYEAVEVVQKGDFDIIFLDMKMPGMDGIQVLERVKEINSEMGVVMMSGYSMEEFTEEAVKKGAYTCVYKPFNMENVFAIIEELQVKVKERGAEEINVLLVDDEESVRETLVDILEDEGYRVTQAETGTQAVQEAGKKFFNIILLDFKLSDMTGLEVAKKVREINEDSCLIMMTGHASLEMAMGAIREEIYDYLVKPVALNQLKQVIKKGLEKQSLSLENKKLMGELQQVNKELKKLAVTDGLTGLYNHRVFQERLKEEIKRAERYHYSLSLCILDLDHFKKYNDTYGHLIGDILLRDVAKICKVCTRETDMVARYGGEEFAIILLETKKEEAFQIAERIRKCVEEYRLENKERNEEIRLTVSGGVATYPDDGKNAQNMVSQADKAMYMAKQSGRNRIEKSTG